MYRYLKWISLIALLMLMVISLLVDVHRSSSREGPGLLTDCYFEKFTSSEFTLSACVQISQCPVLADSRR